jgi:hypothetical protein
MPIITSSENESLIFIFSRRLTQFCNTNENLTVFLQIKILFTGVVESKIFSELQTSKWKSLTTSTGRMERKM